jgi:hypothetical protein
VPGSLVRRAVLVAAAVGAAGAVGAAPASAGTETASSGSVKATLSYKSAGQGKYTNLRVTVRRAGRTFRVTPSVKDRRTPYCAPSRAVRQAKKWASGAAFVAMLREDLAAWRCGAG